MDTNTMIGRIIYTLNTLTIRGMSNMRSIRVALKALREFCERDKDQTMLNVALKAMEEISVIGESDISALLGCMEQVELLIENLSEGETDDHNNQ